MVTAARKKRRVKFRGRGRVHDEIRSLENEMSEERGPTPRHLQSTADGVIVSVRVIPRAAKSGVAGTRGGALLVRLTAPPVEGAANAELIEVLASALGVPKRMVSIVGGERARQKRVHVAGIDAATAMARLGQG